MVKIKKYNYCRADRQCCEFGRLCGGGGGGGRGGGGGDEKAIFGTTDERDGFFRFIYIFFFFRRHCRRLRYKHTMLSRRHCRIYICIKIYTSPYIYTRAINLFKCYSEIISEHDRALRIYCVHTFKRIYIYTCEYANSNLPRARDF